MEAPFSGFCRHICLPEGHRDPRTHSVQGLFVWGGGLVRAPSQALFTRAFCFSRPFFCFFFVLLGPRGPVGLLAARCSIDANIAEWLPAAPRKSRTNSDHELLTPRAAPRNPRGTPATPLCCLDFFPMDKGEMLFFWEFFLETVPLHFGFFQSSTCLRFFRRFCRNELWNGSPGFCWEDFWAQKCPFLCPDNGEKRSSPFLRFFRSSIFVTARFCGGFWAIGRRFCLVLGVRFCMILLI